MSHTIFALAVSLLFVSVCFASLSSGQFYPKLYWACHDRYSPEYHQKMVDHYRCTGRPVIGKNESITFDETHSEYQKTLACYESCILQNFNIITATKFTVDLEYARVNSDHWHFVFEMGNSTDNVYTSQIYEDLLKLNTTEAKKLVTKVSTRCNNTLEEVVNKAKSSCDKWGPLYDCVETTLGCSTETENIPM